MTDPTQQYHHILNEVGALRSQLHNLREFIGGRFNELHGHLHQVDQRITQVMLDISQINQNISDLNAKVTAAETVEDGVVILLQTVTGTLTDLQNQIAALRAQNLQQSDLDQIASQIGTVANKINADTNKLATAAAAVPQTTQGTGTPPASNPPTPSTGTPSSDTPSTPA